jgi:hypothetical protein
MHPAIYFIPTNIINLGIESECIDSGRSRKIQVEMRYFFVVIHKDLAVPTIKVAWTFSNLAFLLTVALNI